MSEIVIGAGEVGVSRDPGATLVTYALGSCIAVTMYDPMVKLGGMVHYMLPESSQCGERANARPWMFADTGIPNLLRILRDKGAEKRRLVIFAAGGAQMMNDNSAFNIGKRNCLALRAILSKSGLVAHAEETGGTQIRTVRLEVGSGRVWLQEPGGERREMHPRR